MRLISKLKTKKLKTKLKTEDTETQKTKTQKEESLVLPKEQVENTDLYKPVINKVMTTRMEFIKYKFVGPVVS